MNDPSETGETTAVTLADMHFSISLEEYFDIYLSQGRTYILVNKQRREAICSNNLGWEKLIVFESIGEDTETSKMYRMKDYIHKESIKPSAKQDNLQKRLWAEKKRHEEVEAWKRTTRIKLQSKKLDEKQISRIIDMAMNPGTNENAWAFRKKLEFPEIKEETAISQTL